MGSVSLRTRRALGGLAAAAGVVAAVTLVARVAGFGRTLVFTEAVRSAGVGAIYTSVNAVPNVLYEVAAGGVLAAVAVPVIGRHLGGGRPAEAHRSVSALLTWTLSILLPLAVLLALFAPVVTRWLVSDTEPGALAVGTTMLRIFAVQVPLYGLGFVLAGYLQAHRRFLAAALAPLQSSLVVIAAYLLYGSLVDGRTSPTAVPHGALLVLAWGTTAGVAVLSLPLLIPARATGWRWRPTYAFPAGDAGRAVRLAGAGLSALLAQQVLVLTTVWLANHRGDDGTITVYSYIQAVYLLPFAVLAVPIATTVVPSLAHAEGAGQDWAATVARATRAVLAVTGLGAGVLLAVAEPVQGFFAALDGRRGGGRVSTAALHELASGLSSYAPGLVGFGVLTLLTRVLYVRGGARRAGLVVAAGWLVAAGYPAVRLAAVGGPGPTLRALGVGSSLGMTLAAAVLVVLVVRAWGRPALAGVPRTGLGVLVALVVGALVGRGVTATWPADGLAASVVVGLVAGLVSAAAYALVLGLVDRRSVLEAIRRGGPASTAGQAPAGEGGARS